jgi:hypothetical protein
MKTVVEDFYAKAAASKDHRRRVAQMVYDAYEFDRKVESDRPETAWLQTFEGGKTFMVRRLTVFAEGEPAKLGYFKVQFDTTGTTVEDAYAYIPKNDIFGQLPTGFLQTLTLEGGQETPDAGWRM